MSVNKVSYIILLLTKLYTEHFHCQPMIFSYIGTWEIIFNAEAGRAYTMLIASVNVWKDNRTSGDYIYSVC